MDLAREAFAGRPLWVVAREQTAGRGRHGRAWASPPGNLHVSFAIDAPCPPPEQPKLGFMAGLALVESIAAVVPSLAGLGLKWPNDVLVDDAKLAGLLVEGGGTVIFGMGVNLVAHPADLPYAATDLLREGFAVTPDALFERLTAELVDGLDHFAGGAGFDRVRIRWLARAAHLRTDVVVRQPDGTLHGRFVDLAGDGAILLETPGGVLRISAGDVFPLDRREWAQHG